MKLQLTSSEASLTAGDWEELADEDALDCDMEVDRIGRHRHKRVPLR